MILITRPNNPNEPRRYTDKPNNPDTHNNPNGRNYWKAEYTLIGLGVAITLIT